ncbi:MAG: ribonuclease J [Synergistaceae bacterium]
MVELKKKKYKRKTKPFSSSELSIIPLGGMGEIGKNLNVFKYNDDIIIVDCGLKFPEDDMLGIDFVIPDIEYLIENKSKIKAIFITHGHEDHIGALPFFLPKLRVPVYCSMLTKGLIENKMQDASIIYEPDFRCISAGEEVEAGSFVVRFIPVCHSIPDSFALAIKTPLGVILHTGDFKLDFTPIDGVTTDFSVFSELAKEGVLLMMSDSTNVERSGMTPSERTVGQTFERLFRLHKDKRIIIATFASNLHRAQQVVNVASRFNRKIVLVGRSMLANMELAQKLGYVDVPEGMLITPQEADLLQDNRIVVLTTGSQGEPFSGLVMMSRESHRTIKLRHKDLVIISATPIPGNEKLVSHTINRLFSCGCEVIYEREEKIHVSGHASRDELTMMLSLIKPKFFVPIHGEYRHLIRHAQLAKELGVVPKNVFILQNGDVLRFKSKTSATIAERVPSGAVLIDGVALGGVESSVLRERKELSENGLVVASLTIDARYNLLSPVQIQTRGSVFSSEDENNLIELEKAVIGALEQFARTPGARQELLATEIRKRVRSVFGKTTRNYPTIVPLITKLDVY